MIAYCNWLLHVKFHIYSYGPNQIIPMPSLATFWGFLHISAFPADMATTASFHQRAWSRHLTTSSTQRHCFNAASQQLYDFPLFHLLWESLSPQRWDINLKLVHGGAMKMSVRHYKGREFYGAHNSAGCCYSRKVRLLPSPNSPLIYRLLSPASAISPHNLVSLGLPPLF